MNKKIVFVILLFIAVSFIIYSFANPMESEENLANSNGYADGENSQNFGNDSDFEEEKENENLEDNDLENSKEDDNTTGDLVIHENQNSSETSKTNVATSKKPITSGNKENNNTNDSNYVDKTPSNPTTPIVPSIPDVPPVVDSKPVEPVTYAELFIDQLEGDNIIVTRKENNFILTGTMHERELTPGIKTGSYLRMRMVAPKAYTTEQLNNMKLKLLYNGNTYTQAQDKILDGLGLTEKAYFYLTQQFVYGKTISILVDWGDGNSILYNFTFNIDVIQREN